MSLRIQTYTRGHHSGLQVSVNPRHQSPAVCVSTTLYGQCVCCVVRYHIRTPSLKLAIDGCSSECYREVEVKSCCPGYWGPDCAVCTCVHGLCDSGLTGNGRCTCFSGYKGPNCDQDKYIINTYSYLCCCCYLYQFYFCYLFSVVLSPVTVTCSPECAALSCQQNSQCMEEALTGQFVCQCLPGYQKSGNKCLSINPCLRLSCHVHASCVHTGPNQHLCACHDGYTGDGRVCMAIDPCQTQQGGCTAKSTRCVYDGPGKSHCECLPGFENLSNGSCSMRDSCRSDSCHKNANCTTVGPGRVQCTCLQGYLGNGKICYGNIMQRLNELNTEPGGLWSGQLSNALSLFGSVSWPLQNLGPFTVFVPINKGFKGILVRTLTADQSKAKYLCKMHLVAGTMPFDSLKKSDVFYTLTGKSAETDTTEGDAQTKIRIHGSRKKGVIVQSDVVASNGMIHLINKLMDSVSPTVESDTEVPEKHEFIHSLIHPFYSFIINSELIFLLNHIVPSTAVSTPVSHLVVWSFDCCSVSQGQILVNGAAVLEAAVEAKNGRLYVVDGVLTPPSIEPVLPHRCDISKTKTIRVRLKCRQKCVSVCDPLSDQGASIFGCVYTFSIGSPAVSIPATGCSPLCNVTVTTPACCIGFYGPDCAPCPGGYQTPCSGHGQCMEGTGGNGSCICDLNFRGSRCQYCSFSNKYGANCDTTCPCIHGQCDNRPDSDGRCKPDSCQMGFTGRFCDRQTAACGVQAQFCHAHADFYLYHNLITCELPPCAVSFSVCCVRFRCVCKRGYQGDGITCVESDPCAPPRRGGCSVNAKCIKTGPGTHSCQCLSGWREDGDECQPVNNCDGLDRGGCHPNATCIYVGPGQVRWTCVCDEGLSGDGHICFGSVDQVSVDQVQTFDK
uniref:Stabilin 2 n=1 Tax=Seriola dumerili TaxID=41447 RepID=A0A3B4UC77_SERDU